MVSKTKTVIVHAEELIIHEHDLLEDLEQRAERVHVNMDDMSFEVMETDNTELANTYKCLLCMTLPARLSRCGLCESYFCKYCIQTSLVGSEKCPACKEKFVYADEDDLFIKKQDKIDLKNMLVTCPDCNQQFTYRSYEKHYTQDCSDIKYNCMQGQCITRNIVGREGLIAHFKVCEYSQHNLEIRKLAEEERKKADAAQKNLN